MKPVLIATTGSQEAQKISATLPRDQKAAIIESSNRLGRLVKESAMVIVDYSFYERYGLENDAFTLGLLHDIGKLLLLQVIGDLQMKKKIGDEVESSELLNTINIHHGKFGAALLKKWKFPEDFAKIAAYHDNLEASKSISKDLLVVHLANLMVKSMGYSLNDQEDAQQSEINLENTESARHLGLDASMIDEFKNKVSDFMQEFGGLLA